MQVEGQEGRIFRSSDWTGGNQNRGRKDEGSVGMTDPRRS